MRDSTSYWEEKLELTSEKFEDRKKALLASLRQKWPIRTLLVAKTPEVVQQVTNQIQSQVLEWFDQQRQSHPYAEYNKKEWLTLYTEWAIVINHQSRDEKRTSRLEKKDQSLGSDADVEMNVTAAPDTESKVASLEVRTPLQIGYINRPDVNPLPFRPIPPAPEPVSSTDNHMLPFTTYPTRTPVTTNPSIRPMNWDILELHIDATAIKLDIISLPMINLKPKNTAGSCHWKDFNLTDLLDNIERDVEMKIDNAFHEFVYEGFSFSRQGGYSIALKRFVESYTGGNRGLNMVLRRKDQIGGSIQGQERLMEDRNEGLRGEKRSSRATTGAYDRAVEVPADEEKTDDEEDVDPPLHKRRRET